MKKEDKMLRRSYLKCFRPTALLRMIPPVKNDLERLVPSMILITEQLPLVFQKQAKHSEDTTLELQAIKLELIELKARVSSQSKMSLFRLDLLDMIIVLLVWFVLYESHCIIQLMAR